MVVDELRSYELLFELLPLVLRDLEVLTEIRDVVDEDIALNERSRNDAGSEPWLEEDVATQGAVGSENGVAEDPETKRVDKASSDVVLETRLCGTDESRERSPVTTDEFHGFREASRQSFRHATQSETNKNMSEQLSAWQYSVQLEDKKGKSCCVTVEEKGVKCSCDEFVYRKAAFICKHIRFVMQGTNMQIGGKSMQQLVMSN